MFVGTRNNTTTFANQKPTPSKTEVKASSPAVKRTPLVARGTTTNKNLRESSSKVVNSPRERSTVRTSMENVSVASNVTPNSRKINVSKSLAFGSPIPDTPSKKTSTTPKMLTCPEP